MSPSPRERAPDHVSLVACAGLLCAPTGAMAAPVQDDEDPRAEGSSADASPEAELDEAAKEGSVDHSSSWEPLEPEEPPPATTSAATPGPTQPPPPSTPAPDLDDQAKIKTAESVAIAGAVFAGVGAVSLIVVSGGAFVLAKVAEDRANDDPILVSEQELRGRAERRLRFARISAIPGASALLVGGILLAAGLGSRATIRARQRELALAPMLGPATQGLQLHLRF